MAGGATIRYPPDMRIAAKATAKVTVDRSRFFALAFPAATLEDAQAVVQAQRATHRRARHHCWAARLPDGHGGITEACRDDGEVGHPGRVLLELLRSRELEGGVVVSRIFGGVKLGPGGVARAFRAAGEGALDAAAGHRPTGG